VLAVGAGSYAYNGVTRNVTSAAAVAVTAGTATETAIICIGDGVLEAKAPTNTLSFSAGGGSCGGFGTCSASTGSSCSAGRYEIASATMATGTFDVSGITDFRAGVTQTALTAGTGIVISGYTVSVDTAVVGDFSSNTTSSVDGEVVLFSGTAGKTGKRATGSGLAKLTSGVLGTASAGTDYVSPSSTESLTNKTIDAEGTGNVLTIPFKSYLPAAGCNQTAAGPGFDVPSANGPVASCYGTAPRVYAGLDFADGSAALTSSINLKLPSDWTGAVDLVLDWFCSSGSGCSTNQVDWTVRTVCVGTAASIDAPTFNATQDNLFAASATQYNRLSSSITGITMTGCSAGNALVLRIGRDPTNGSDTLAATATLLGVEVTLRRAM
jgi:hypothetical protein